MIAQAHTRHRVQFTGSKYVALFIFQHGVHHAELNLSRSGASSAGFCKDESSRSLKNIGCVGS